jgi:hypothetical protein
MHRSGTSVITRGLEALGVYLGDSLLGPQPDNPKGYWEHWRILGVNEAVMAAIDRPWSSSRPIPPATWEGDDLDELKDRAASVLVDLFRGRPLWGFKDPRTIRLFPFWSDVLRRLGPSVSIVLAIRPPQSAIESLVERDAMSSSDADELWLEYMLPSLPAIAEYPVLVVDYDRLIRSPIRELRRMAKRLEATIDPTDPTITEYTKSFVDRGLRHHVHPAGNQTLADETYRALLRLTRTGASWRRCLQLAERHQAERRAPAGARHARQQSSDG